MKNVEPEPAVRLYCEQQGATWNLQIRAFRASGSRYGKGKEFFVATAPLDVEDMRALRDAIDQLLKEAS